MLALMKNVSFMLALVACILVLDFDSQVSAADDQPLPLSDMRVEIHSQGKTATFRLYDTTAAREFYDQLPLTLDLTNFRDAQWMFYPPEKLNVKPSEAYHDGKKGELSYYAPWGDVFMLYKDFYAGDEMHRLGVGLSGIEDIAAMSGSAVVRKMEPLAEDKGKVMQITVTSNGTTITYELNDSQAAKDLYAQLPLEIEVEDYGGKEKIYYPPKKLNTSNTPLVKSAHPGTLAYYAPWADVVMFYGSFASASGLYELGEAIKGTESIRSLSGTIRIEAR
ncbi:cyclophilin-like fold protein [Pseudodesulfovibrio thermohalotolerans]|uniref:cyclophilin-like fold protein n=1 Tax=Pseudodesulfovibrio thermohalotolerans TaxID=2880651 RepID=UPI00244175FE|nr:cyclophilin-like fold protein [Pseudodesulfovibrio thermohalotolerans]WFS61913.1 cyclophilin-like fold protein [Pseudodesulfovibrio thermohalotolerans]